MKENNRIISVIKSTRTKLSNGMRRFPVAICYAALASGIGVVLIHNEDLSNSAERLLTSVILSLILGAVVSLSMKTIFDQFEPRQRNRIFFWIIFGCGTLLYAMYLFNNFEGGEQIEMVRLAALLLAAFVLFMTAVFRKNTPFQEVYSTLAGWRMAITVVYTLVIWGGISLILFAIEKLLGVDVEEKLYLDTIVLAAGFFAPMFFFGGIPEKSEVLEPGRIYKFFKILVIYVIAPLLSAYTVVFYIYVLRILFIWEWPDGVVGNMVLWYALIGTVAMYFLHGMDEGSKWAAVFGRWFPRVVIIPIILLFISLGIRIGAYGLTMNRYLLGAAGIWMLGSMIYLSIVNYRKRNTRIITVSLAVIAVLSVVGPWNAIAIGRISQTNRLEKLLVNNNMISDGMVIKADPGISDKTKGEISSKVEYLESVYGLQGVDYLPADFSIGDMGKVMGFDYFYYYEERPADIKDTEYISINQKNTGGILDVSGFDYLWDTENWDKSSIETPGGSLSFRFMMEQGAATLDIELDGVVVFTRNLYEFMPEIKEKWIANEGVVEFDDLTFDFDVQGIGIRLVFTGIEMYDEGKGLETGWLRCAVLVKME
ncbi:MAG: DUF4153 domain-containing protein [Clostridia bacterium]|nr:DUF4153 domain-containing protein [Clostridia bacterium]